MYNTTHTLSYLRCRYSHRTHQSPTQYDLPLTLCTGPAPGSVTAHSYHTFPFPTHRHTCASTPFPAGTSTGVRRGKYIGNQLNMGSFVGPSVCVGG